MLSFPQPGASDMKSLEPSRYPVVQLSDSSEDLAYFFDAMYNGMRCVSLSYILQDIFHGASLGQVPILQRLQTDMGGR